jgi:hypothetical protein
VRSLLALVGATTGARRQVHQPEPYKSSRSSLLNDGINQLHVLPLLQLRPEIAMEIAIC